MHSVDWRGGEAVCNSGKTNNPPYPHHNLHYIFFKMKKISVVMPCITMPVSQSEHRTND